MNFQQILDVLILSAPSEVSRHQSTLEDMGFYQSSVGFSMVVRLVVGFWVGREASVVVCPCVESLGDGTVCIKKPSALESVGPEVVLRCPAVG